MQNLNTKLIIISRSQHFLQDSPNKDSDKPVHTLILISHCYPPDADSDISLATKCHAKIHLGIRDCAGWSVSSLGAHVIMWERLRPIVMRRFKVHIKEAFSTALSLVFHSNKFVFGIEATSQGNRHAINLVKLIYMKRTKRFYRLSLRSLFGTKP